LLTGSNADEANNIARPVPSQVYIEQSKVRFGSMFNSYIHLYPSDSEEQAGRSQILYMTDWVAWMTWTSAKLQTINGKSKAYLYYFTRQPPTDAPIKGAAHSGELYYVFHNLNLYKQQWGEWDYKLEDLMSSYWTNFAKSGDPNGANLSHWPPYNTKESYGVMVFGNKVDVGSSRLAKPNRDWFDTYYATQVAK
jgi:para-nitrobenzyl esterase